MLHSILFLLGASLVQTQASTLSIKTTTGTANGFINGSTPNVRRWQGIPFAAAPVGDLRWAPPTTAGLDCAADINATYQRATCSQSSATGKSLYSENVQQFFPTPPFDEDCLYLNVYAPLDSKYGEKELLPVFVWIHGGGFATGGIQTAYELPMKWVERTKDHIVVPVK
jgi:acetylcholinesterase